MREYVDSDLVIWHLRDSTKAASYLKSLRADPGRILCLGALQRAENVFFPVQDHAGIAASIKARHESVRWHYDEQPSTVLASAQ